MSKVYLFPGDLHASAEPSEIGTLLGSCVSVVLVDSMAGVAGMSHFLLPFAGPSVSPGGRHGEYALPELLKQMIELGAVKCSIQARVFGGGNVVSGLNPGNTAGDQNVAFAESWLKGHNIPIIENQTGGSCGMRITLSTATGVVEQWLIEPLPILKSKQKSESKRHK